jgi:PhoPQ-activated pathogenicity-related protein
MINASGDQFFVPDSAQFYFQDLPGVKYLRYVPNADHSLKGSDAWETLLACYSSVVKGSRRPQFSWTLEADGSIRVKTQDRASAVKLWQATNPNARDFRVDSIGQAWTSTELKDEGGGVYIAIVEKPDKGWTAFFAELTYDSGTAAPYKFTTQVRVVPDVKPFKYQTPTPPR